MSQEAHPLFSRLQQRCSELGGDLSGLSSWSGVPVARLLQLAKGGVPTTDEFEAMCRGLVVDPAAVFAGEERSPKRAVARFRTAVGQSVRPDTNDLRLLALAAEQGRILAYLLQLLGREVALGRHRAVRPLGGRSDPWEKGYLLGEQARQSLGIPPGPLLELERTLNELGVHVARVQFSSPDIDAASVWEPGAVPILLLNLRSGRVDYSLARRAVLGHELCHLLHDGGEADLTTSVSWGADGTGNYRDKTEARARGFAPAFLATRPQVKAWSAAVPGPLQRSPREIVLGLANHWGLSFEGAAWHAKSSRLITPEEAEREASSRDKPAIEAASRFEADRSNLQPVRLPQGLPDEPAPIWQGWAAKLVGEVVADGAISAGRAREILTWA